MEFLLKDYLIAEQPAAKADIEKVFLGRCIKTYVRDPRIKKAAKHAALLGNDQTHYHRLNTNSDIDDLKRLMKLVIYWIAAEIATKALVP